MNILDAAIRLVIYAGVFLSLTYLFRSTATATIGLVRHRVFGIAQRRRLLRHDHVSDPLVAALAKRHLFTTHITDLLEATIVRNVSTEITFRRFLYGSLGLGGGFYLVAYFSTDSFLAGLPFFAFGTFLPYLVLLIYKQRLSIQNSYDIQQPITLLGQKYARHNHKMMVALQETLNDLPETPIKRALARLTIRLERHASEQEAIEAVQSFNNQTGTSWASRLSALILDGIERMDVATALTELEAQMTRVRTTLANEKATRTDTLLLGIAPTLLLPASLGFSYLSVTHNTFRLLLGSRTGWLGLILAVTVAVLGPLIAFAFYKPKQDL